MIKKVDADAGMRQNGISQITSEGIMFRRFEGNPPQGDEWHKYGYRIARKHSPRVSELWQVFVAKGKSGPYFDVKVCSIGGKVFHKANYRFLFHLGKKRVCRNRDTAIMHEGRPDLMEEVCNILGGTYSPEKGQSRKRKQGQKQADEGENEGAGMASPAAQAETA